MSIPAFSFQTGQRQTQTQTLSPRLQHAVRLLQMSAMEFEQSLNETLGRNPFLENDEGAAAPLPPKLALLAGPLPQPAAIDPPAPAHEVEQAPEHGFDERAGWADGTPARQHSDAAGTAEFNPLDLLASPVALNAHLHGQLDLLRLDPRDRALAKAVVESLDDDGYLRSDPFDWLNAAGMSPPPDADEVLIAVRRVQSLEPLGVAARSVQECLMLQLERIESPVRRALARRLLLLHLPLIAARDVAGIARHLQCPLAEADAVCAAIRRFDPRPGGRFSGARVLHVTPEVIARRRGRRWIAVLNEAAVPRVRLNQGIVDLLQRQRGPGVESLTSHLQEARWTLRNVEQRFSTIVSVAQAILDRQQHCLAYGEMAMKPLGLREIADAVGVHESTVSRVTCNKFIATPAGVFEMKRFFSRAMVMPGGHECSGTAIRGLVRDMIASEGREQPLSDADITQLLAQQGLSVARRTVTKYRQALQIEPVARRRSSRAVPFSALPDRWVQSAAASTPGGACP